MSDPDRLNEVGARQGARVPPLAAMFMMIAMLPSLVIFVTGMLSLAIGTSLAAVLVLLTTAAYPNQLMPRLRRCILVFAAIVLLICLHLAISGLLHPVDFSRAIASFAPLLIAIVGGSALGAAIGQASDRRIDRAISIVFWVMCVVVVLPRIGIRPPAAGSYPKALFPFTEPSLFALAFMPLYTYACISAAATRRIVFLALGLVLVIALESLTLAVGWVVVALLCTRGLVLPVLMAIAIGGVLVLADLSYFLDRLDFSGDSENLSTLVWLQGWQLAQEALAATHAWGAGFQQLGIYGTNTEISRVIYLLTGNDLNILDGGFVAAKFVSEFGVIGMVIIAAFLVIAGKSMFVLRAAARNPGAMPKATLFMHAVFVGYLVELLVRGAGYFSGSLILLVAALQLRADAAARLAEFTRPRPAPSNAAGLRQ